LCNVDDPPTIDTDGQVIAHGIHTFQPPAEEPENPDDGGGRRRGRRRRFGDNPEMVAIENAHKDRPGWISILAWSHGASNGSSRYGRGSSNMQDFSMTKYSDNASPQMTVMVMVGEVLPHGILRVVYAPDDGKVKFIEFVMKNVQISSISTGGSGGEDRLTENITVQFSSVFMRHVTINIEDGKFLEDSKGQWDGETKKGDRDGVFNVLPLKTLCKRAVTSNVDLFDSRALARLPRAILEELELSHITAQLKLPLKGRRVVFTTDEIDQAKRTRYREAFMKKLTVDGLKAAVSAVIGVGAATIKGIYGVSSSALILLEKPEQVEDLSEGAELFVAL